MTREDVAVATAIAIAVILIAIVFWPGYARVRSSDLQGNWADEYGNLYNISPYQGSEKEIVILSMGSRVIGKVGWLRKIIMGDAEGHVTFSGEIVWNSGPIWIRQGIQSSRLTQH